MTPLKLKRWRSEKYLKWIRTLSCKLCGAPGSEAHHLIGVSEGIMGGKAPDWQAMPLCRSCHNRTHAEPCQPQERWMRETLNEAFSTGVLKID